MFSSVSSVQWGFIISLSHYDRVVEFLSQFPLWGESAAWSYAFFIHGILLNAEWTPCQHRLPLTCYLPSTSLSLFFISLYLSFALILTKNSYYSLHQRIISTRQPSVILSCLTCLSLWIFCALSDSRVVVMVHLFPLVVQINGNCRQPLALLIYGLANVVLPFSERLIKVAVLAEVEKWTCERLCIFFFFSF